MTTTSGRQRFGLRTLFHIAAVSAALLSSTVASAQVQTILAAPTSLTSTAERMISYRAQEHSWQTSDGAIHLMRNVGTVPSGQSLVLASSYDNGNSWTDMLALSGTDLYSTSDGQLSGNTLAVTYATATPAAQVKRAILTYDIASKTWSLGRTETVFAEATSSAMNPALAPDGQGNLWAAFTVRDLATGNYSIRMAQRPANRTRWVDTGLVFGVVDNLSIERGAKPVPIKGGVGMVFKVRETYYWATRTDGAPVTQPWTVSTLFVSQPPYDNDPYASHFSVVADKSNNLYMAIVDHGQLLFLRYLSKQPGWSAPRALTPDLKATYPQLTLASGNVTVMVNDSVQVRVLQSFDFGKTFSTTYKLMHAPAPDGSGLDYSNPRIEAPAYATAPIPTLQQYVEQGVQRLMFFSVPVVPPVKAP